MYLLFLAVAFEGKFCFPFWADNRIFNNPNFSLSTSGFCCVWLCTAPWGIKTSRPFSVRFSRKTPSSARLLCQMQTINSPLHQCYDRHYCFLLIPIFIILKESHFSICLFVTTTVVSVSRTTVIYVFVPMSFKYLLYFSFFNFFWEWTLDSPVLS